MENPYKSIYLKYLDPIMDTIKKWSATPTTPADLFFKTCFLRIYSNSLPIYNLLIDGRIDQAEMIIRSSLESYARLSAVNNKPEILDRIRYTENVKRIKTIKYLLSCSDDESNKELIEQKKEIEKVNTEFENQGVKEINIYQVFSEAKMDSIYRSPYNHFCGTHHNSLISMQERFIEEYEPGNYRIVLENETSVEDSKLFWSMAIWILHNSFSKIMVHLGIEYDDIFNELANKFKALDEESPK